MKVTRQIIVFDAADLAAEGHQVYADPAGHPFCIGWGHPSDDRIREIYQSISADDHPTPPR